MSAPTTTSPTALPQDRLLDALFGGLWPEPALAGRPRRVVAALGVGLLAAVVVPFRAPGIGCFAVLVVLCGVVATSDGRLRTPYHLLCGALCLLLLSTVALRDAPWLVALSVLAALGVGAGALAGARSVPGLLAAGAAVPLAALRGLPWLSRSLRVSGRPATWWPAVRTALVSLGLLLVFGGLFASADAVFAGWAGALVPDLTLDDFAVRGFVLLGFGGLTLTLVYVALNPPRVERLALPAGRPVRRRFEWLVPVGLVVLVFAVFVVAQLTVMFGGHGYLRRTTGLTYAEYVHQGFGQLTFATVLTLAVVATAARKAQRRTGPDRVLLRVALGSLSALTLVVVASALYRLHVYEQAYGFTRLRLLVAAFEGWLGVVIVLVLLAGVALRGRWVPRAALLTGAAVLLALAAVNPDAYIARHNIDRFERTGRIDWSYLAGLSADAAPALAAPPERYRGCVIVVAGPAADQGDDWLAWNLGRARARAALQGGHPEASAGCLARP